MSNEQQNNELTTKPTFNSTRVCQKCKLNIVSSTSHIRCDVCKSFFHPDCAAEVKLRLTGYRNSESFVFQCHQCLIETVSPVANMEDSLNKSSTRLSKKISSNDEMITSNQTSDFQKFDELDSYLMPELSHFKLDDACSTRTSSSSSFEDLVSGFKFSTQGNEKFLPKLNINSKVVSKNQKIVDVENSAIEIPETNVSNMHSTEGIKVSGICSTEIISCLADEASILPSEVTAEILLKQDENTSKLLCTETIDHEESIEDSLFPKLDESNSCKWKVDRIESFIHKKLDNTTCSSYTGIPESATTLGNKTMKLNAISRIKEKFPATRDGNISEASTSCIETTDQAKDNAISSRLSGNITSFKNAMSNFNWKITSSEKIFNYLNCCCVFKNCLKHSKKQETVEFMEFS
uniref:PHD-type domain-containing protein n=1 Tax=Glossina brevipalpis TaxID=37001 RepID=A0A1A9VZB8_9MUSC